MHDIISVWKQPETCTIVFKADSENDNNKDKEVEYKQIPVKEQLPTDMAAPCLQHLLVSHNTSVVLLERLSCSNYDNEPDVTFAKASTEFASRSSEVTNSRKQISDILVRAKTMKQKVGSSYSPEMHGTSDYSCPW